MSPGGKQRKYLFTLNKTTNSASIPGWNIMILNNINQKVITLSRICRKFKNRRVVLKIFIFETKLIF